MNVIRRTYGKQISASDWFRSACILPRLCLLSRFLGALAFGVSALSMASLASAQSALRPETLQNDPVANPQRQAATPNTDKSVDIKPETLGAANLESINPRHIGRNGSRSNRWNTQTLTRPVALSSIKPRSGGTSVSVKHVPGIAQLGGAHRPMDVMSTQDLLDVTQSNTPKYGVAIEKTPQSDAVTNLSSTLRGALFDMPSIGSVDQSVFKLDLAGQLCLGTADECKRNETQRIELGFAKDITTGRRGGLNLQLTPRGHLQVGDDGKSALVGALVRIGDDLRKGSKMNSNTWYFFAGADAEALTFTPNSVRRLTSGDFHLQDRIIVGDAQAGVGYRIGDADVALTYMRRQTSAENYSYDSDAAALSLTWRR